LYLLPFIIKIFESLSFSDLEGDNPERMHSISLLKLLETMGEDPYLLLRLSSQPEAEEEDDEERLTSSSFSKVGLSCYLYVSFCLKEFPSIPTVLNPSYLFVLCLPYIETLFREPKSALKGLSLALFLAKRVEPFKLTLEDFPESPYYRFFQSLINFMVNCPVAKIRYQTFQLFNSIVDFFESNTRLDILQNLISNCPYTGAIGNFITKLKDNILRDWPQVDQKPNSVFISSRIFEEIPHVTSESEVLQSNDIILSTLSFYRFLLLRDKKTNYTGIWSKKILSKVKEEYLIPLRKSIDLLTSQAKDPKQKKEEMKKATSGGVAFPSLTKHEFEHAHSFSITTLDMMSETLLRVEEIVELGYEK